MAGPLTEAYTRLGFDAVDDEAFAQLGAGPDHRADLEGRLGARPERDRGASRTMFRSLQRACERDYRATITTACFEHAMTTGDVSLVLYDVTTFYFEAENEDQLRKVGYSKERRVDPLLVVGLLVDRRGFPLEIGCFQGN